ncbi:MAG: DUF5060 domain-containing protein [Acidobacteriota bacterium]
MPHRLTAKTLVLSALVALLLPMGAYAADVASFTLIDAGADVPVAAHAPLQDGAVLDLSNLPSGLNVRADVDGAVGSVTFDLSGADTQTQTESVAPYALFGDSSGDYNAWTPPLGAYTLTARSHTDSGGGGTAGADLTIEFTVTDGAPPPADGDGSVAVEGRLERWHRVTVVLSGPGASETSTPNPFLDHRFQVVFTGPSGQRYKVPGYFAGDGGVEPAAQGNVWHAHLAPDEVGSWTFETSFRVGPEAAVDLTGTAGSVLPPFDGVTGGFEIVESTASGADFRAPDRGLIRNRGGHFLTEADGDVWLKGGPDIPENFLGYDGFDNTPNAGHAFAAHDGDWRPGDPAWGGDDRGHGIIGALNFLAERGANVIYFLPMNLGGDGRDTFPTIAESEKTRYDLSKLAQWEQVFTHAQSRGIFLHFVLAETEPANETYHDDGALGPERKLFYRMLVARFGHHLGLEWNLGEENDYGTAKLEEFASYIKAIDPSDHPLTTHTKSGQYAAYYGPLLGNGDFDITSFQGSNSRTSMFDLVVDWRQQSAAAGVPWAISFDEPQKIENDVDDDVAGYPHGRRDKMWPVYMAGGAGFEWYVQQDGGGHSFDQQIDDYNLMASALSWTGHALDFFALLPLEAMTPNRALATAPNGEAYALALPGSVYAVYADRSGGPLGLDLSAAPALPFSVRWFDPRAGGPLQIGTVPTVTGGAVVDLGEAPSAVDNDWAVLVVADVGLLFADGFESGDTTSWGAASP